MRDLKPSSSYLSATWSHNGQDRPQNVHAVTTLKTGGVSLGDFQAFNLAMHVDDNPQAVKANRDKLRTELALPAEPVWLAQVHSNNVINIDQLSHNNSASEIIPADASITRTAGQVCAVLTADCLPVFFCNTSGTEVAVAHAGWRGLHAGIIRNTVKAMQSPPDEIRVSLGPAIGPQAFEVGTDVYNAFVTKNAENVPAFVAAGSEKYYCDIYKLARIELQALGVFKVAGGDFCTYRDNNQFYSFRRRQKTGRMASLIWFT